MAYALKHGEKLADGIRRVIRKQLRQVAQEVIALENADAIHHAREGLKKSRAALRLVRKQLGRKTYRRLNRRLRAMAFTLSTQRDAEVLLNTLDKLSTSEIPARATLERLRAATQKQQSGPAAHAKNISRTGKKLQAARREIKQLPLDELKWNDLCRGVRRTYKQGLEAYQKAELTYASRDLHAWRKRVKDLRYQLQLLSAASPEALEPLAAEAKILGEYLGDDHDFAAVEAAAQAVGFKPRTLAVLKKITAPQRQVLQKSAFALGKHFYRLKPSQFARQIKHCRKTFGKTAKPTALHWVGARKFQPVARASARAHGHPGEFVPEKNIRPGGGLFHPGSG